MWFSFTTIATLCIVSSLQIANKLEIVFKERSHLDWKEVWHREKYTRCRENLIKHLYWACEKDIYRLTRRNSNDLIKNNDEFKYGPWITSKRAKSFLRFRRGIYRQRSPSITSECCKSSGCTWEEYAEYCPTNKRYTSYI